MPRFIVTSGSNFQPFTYDELIKPVEAAQKYHDAAQDTYDTLSMETSALGNYISENPDDANARAMYDNYQHKLRTLQDNLWRSGVTAGTRRDLNEAKTAYSRDMLRLQTAIKSRQERSKAYWDMKHAHPDMIMGADPGSSGLDNYLRDDNFGQDYYAYSGDSFMNEVGADAKARAIEIKRAYDYDGKSIPGYITRIEKEGFTSEEVAEADIAVRNAIASGRRDFSGISEPAQILAQTLISHIDSTGAQGKVSDDEFGRLLDYGRAGLSQAIGKTELKDFSDKQWDFNQQMRIARAKSGGTETPQPAGYAFNNIISENTAGGYRWLQKKTSRNYKAYDGDPKTVNNPDGTSSDVSSPFGMSELVYNPPVRQKIMSKYGLDVALPASNFFGTTASRQSVTLQTKDKKSITLTTSKLSDDEAKELGLQPGDIALRYGSDKRIHRAATIEFNEARHEYEKHVQEYRDANPDLDIDEMSITPEKERELRERYGIDRKVASSDIEALVTTKEYHGDYTPATLVSTDSGDDYARENFGRALIESFNRNTAFGNNGKGSRFAIYPVGKGGAIGEKGETDLKNIFGKSKDGDALTSAKAITSMTLSPRDVAEAAAKGQTPKVMFSTTTNPGKIWAADITMLGTQVKSALTTPVYSNGFSVQDAVSYMMEPLTDPNAVLSMSDKEAQSWSKTMYRMLNDGSRQSFTGPAMYDESGKLVLVSAKDIVRDPQLRDQLYQSVTDYLTTALRAATDINQISHPQNAGNSSTKASYYRQ